MAKDSKNMKEIIEELELHTYDSVSNPSFSTTPFDLFEENSKLDEILTKLEIHLRNQKIDNLIKENNYEEERTTGTKSRN